MSGLTFRLNDYQKPELLLDWYIAAQGTIRSYEETS